MNMTRRMFKTAKGSALIFFMGIAMLFTHSAFAGDKAMPVSTETLEKASSFQTEKIYIGRIEAPQTSRLGFEIGGMVNELLSNEGDNVAAGQEIARLDTKRLEARAHEAQAAVNQARADLDLAIATLKRTQEAADINAVSKQQLDEAIENKNARQAALERAQASLETVQVDLDKSVLYAPYDGHIIMRNVDQGDVVQAGMPVFHIQETGNLEARVGQSTENTGQIKPGDKVDIQANGKTLNAVVKAVIQNRDLRARTYEAILEISETITLQPGDLIELPVTDRIEKPGFVVPVSALVEGARGLWAVYVVQDKDGEMIAERRSVDLLATQDDMAFVQGSIRSNEKIINKGVHRIVPGQAVSMQDKGAP